MQGLVRYAQPRPGCNMPISEPSLMSCKRYQLLPDGDAANFDQVHGSNRCLITESRLFKFILGIVICANAIVIGMEADLGLLGPASPHWKGLETDLQGVRVGDDSSIEAELSQGLLADAKLKDQMASALHGALRRSIDVNSDLDLPSGSGQLRSAAYTSCEFVFVFLFVCEMFVRLCDLGRHEYWCHYPWMLLDVTVSALGVTDVMVPFILDVRDDTLHVMPFLRTLRVLRLLKLFQVSQDLYIIGCAFMKAFRVVILVGFVVLLLDFGLAVILTSLVGQSSFLWAAQDQTLIDRWFGSVGKSMHTLFTIQALSGWDHISTILGLVIPTSLLVPCIVLYMLLCCFSVMGLITSVIGDSFEATQRREHDLCKLDKQLRRREVIRTITDMLSSYAQSTPSSISRSEFEIALDVSPICKILESLDVVTGKGHLLELYDKLKQHLTPSNDIKVEHLAEAVASIAGCALACSVFELKRCIQGMCFEMSLLNESATRNAETHGQETRMHSTRFASQITELQKEMATLQQDMTCLIRQVAAVSEKLEAREGDAREQSEAVATIHEKIASLAVHAADRSTIDTKLDAVMSQLAAQSVVSAKMDALAAQVIAQATANAKVEALMEQLSAQLTGLHSDEKSHTKLQTDEAASRARSASEPAAEPDSIAVLTEIKNHSKTHLAAADSETGILDRPGVAQLQESEGSFLIGLGLGMLTSNTSASGGIVSAQVASERPGQPHQNSLDGLLSHSLKPDIGASSNS